MHEFLLIRRLLQNRSYFLKKDFLSERIDGRKIKKGLEVLNKGETGPIIYQNYQYSIRTKKLFQTFYNNNECIRF